MGAQCEADLTDDMADILRETFDIEIEMLEGTTEDLGDGLTRYKFKVNEEKGKLIETFLIRCISRSHQIIYN